MPYYMRLEDIKGDASPPDTADSFVFADPVEPEPYVGGWGSSVYQYAYSDPASSSDAARGISHALNFEEIKIEGQPTMDDFLFG
jgi:hypothetical protein